MFLKICLKKLNFFENLPVKSKFLKMFMEKSKLFKNLPGKIEISLTWIHGPQISNRIDAAGLSGSFDHDPQRIDLLSIKRLLIACSSEFPNLLLCTVPRHI